jgi:hypothetical protein
MLHVQRLMGTWCGRTVVGEAVETSSPMVVVEKEEEARRVCAEPALSSKFLLTMTPSSVRNPAPYKESKEEPNRLQFIAP